MVDDASISACPARGPSEHIRVFHRVCICKGGFIAFPRHLHVSSALISSKARLPPDIAKTIYRDKENVENFPVTISLKPRSRKKGEDHVEVAGDLGGAGGSNREHTGRE